MKESWGGKNSLSENETRAFLKIKRKIIQSVMSDISQNDINKNGKTFVDISLYDWCNAENKPVVIKKLNFRLFNEGLGLQWISAYEVLVSW